LDESTVDSTILLRFVLAHGLQSPPGAMPAASSPRVLLVDDEEALVWSLSNRLGKARAHLTVDTANDGETALAKIRARPVDLLVADVRMPGMHGTDLILEARRLLPSLPVIIMTAFKTADVQSMARASATHFLEKPFDFDRFVSIVDESLATPTVGFSGAISVQTLPDIVQLYVLSAQTGVLRVRHRSGDGELYFKQGAITHAQTLGGDTGGLVGEDAFFEIMLWSGGEFSTRMGAMADSPTIATNWTELLMESCRRLDERRRDREGRPSRTGWTLAPTASVEDDPFDFDIGEPAPPQGLDHLVTQTGNNGSEEERMNIKDSLAKLNSIDGFVGAALVDSESGMLLGQEGGGSLNMEVAAAGNTEVVRSKRKTMGNLNLRTRSRTCSSRSESSTT
jgi:CheY-like chemotaxis protein